MCCPWAWMALLRCCCSAAYGGARARTWEKFKFIPSRTANAPWDRDFRLQSAPCAAGNVMEAGYPKNGSKRHWGLNPTIFLISFLKTLSSISLSLALSYRLSLSLPLRLPFLSLIATENMTTRIGQLAQHLDPRTWSGKGLAAHSVKNENDVVIVAIGRTPFCKARKGSLKDTP